MNRLLALILSYVGPYGRDRARYEIAQMARPVPKGIVRITYGE